MGAAPTGYFGLQPHGVGCVCVWAERADSSALPCPSLTARPPAPQPVSCVERGVCLFEHRVSRGRRGPGARARDRPAPARSTAPPRAPRRRRARRRRTRPPSPLPRRRPVDGPSAGTHESARQWSPYELNGGCVRARRLPTAHRAAPRRRVWAPAAATAGRRRVRLVACASSRARRVALARAHRAARPAPGAARRSASRARTLPSSRPTRACPRGTRSSPAACPRAAC